MDDSTALLIGLLSVGVICLGLAPFVPRSGTGLAVAALVIGIVVLVLAVLQGTGIATWA